MINQLWRYSHFALAVSSSVFVLLASITGGILALEPIENKLQPFSKAALSELRLAPLVDSLQGRYDEVLELSIDANEFVQVAVIGMVDSLDGDFYINPVNGAKIGDIPSQKPFYKFVTNLHRSLFLKTIGRVFVGLTSFFMFLIAISGLLLFIKRQNGLRYFFKRPIKETFAQHYHVILGRWMLMPILIIALTGVYLSLVRFSIIEDKDPVLHYQSDSISSKGQIPLVEFEIFQNTSLSEVRKLEFPFSPDVEDFYTLSLQDRQFKINQINGNIEEELRYPLSSQMFTLSLNLHTGVGSIIWSVVLLIASINILFFMYTGAMISYRRLRSRLKNTIKDTEAEIVILVGSENGTTRSFAQVLQQALLKQQQKVLVDELNAYRPFPAMKHLLVLSSTYGLGEPPSNAHKFFYLLEQQPPQQSVQCEIVGFGSRSYKDFCQYAIDIESALRATQHCQVENEAFLINNQNYTSFVSWAHAWSQKIDLELDLPPKLLPKKVKTHDFALIDKQLSSDGYAETFLLYLKAKGLRFSSGDLLAITPPEETFARQYSVAKLDRDTILLSIKKHETGICSNYLHQLELRTQLKAELQINKAFHLPKRSSSINLIANGTGIAPFLGMMQEHTARTPIYLYWGGRNAQSYELYRLQLEKALAQGQLTDLNLAYSRQESTHRFVQDILMDQQDEIAQRLKEGGVFMICGSLAMQDAVLSLLEEISLSYHGKDLSYFLNKGQILMDCY
ncbi:MAG: PepSY domain-containing protein [Bacteroidota bacterium]